MITEDRKKHIFGVAELMQEYAKSHGYSTERQKELFTLGLLHDVGYAFLEPKDYETHEMVGGTFLKEQGYKFWQEVYYHGVVNSPYTSEELNILNWADMHIDGTGNRVSYEESLLDISRRHNVPVEELRCRVLVEELKAKGFD